VPKSVLAANRPDQRREQSFGTPQRRIKGLKVFLSARADIYGGADAAREWSRWAAPPKPLGLLPGSDLLRRCNPLRRSVENLLVRFTEQAAPAR
jgi:hypothetical protein